MEGHQEDKSQSARKRHLERQSCQLTTASLGCVLMLALLAAPFFLAAWSNDTKMFHLKQAFQSIPHPAGTKRVKTASGLGILIWNSNRCHYVLAELRRYSGDKKQIIDFYSHVTVYSPISGKHEKIEVFFLDEHDHLESTELERLNKDYGWGLFEVDNPKHYYLLYYHDGHDPGLDLRCI